MQRPLRKVVICALMCLLTLAAGCSGPARPGSTATSTEPAHAESSAPSSTPVAVPDPRSLTGPTTAAAVTAVEPIATSSTPKLPATVTDDKGRQVTVASADRILALDIYGTLTETVVALGLGERLVGRTTSTTDPAYAALPNVTPSGHELNTEAILALAPTIVLADGTLGPQEIYTQLEQSGVSVVFTSPKRAVDLIASQVTAVAAALGVADAGSALNHRVSGEIAAAGAAIAEMAPKDAAGQLRIAFLYVRGSGSVFFIFGKGSGADGLITALHGVDVASSAGITDYKPASAESLAVINPEVILMMSSGLNSAGGIDGILARPGMSATAAGTAKRIIDMEDGTVLSFGPNYAKVLRSLANAIYLAK